MKIFIWEGGGISSAYHDDGTLVVLAESPEQAREIIRDGRNRDRATERAWKKERDDFLNTRKIVGNTRAQIWDTPEGRAIWARYPPSPRQFWDGSDEALDRAPDRVVELDKPTWVAFNGGGYD